MNVQIFTVLKGTVKKTVKEHVSVMCFALLSAAFLFFTFPTVKLQHIKHNARVAGASYPVVQYFLFVAV
jgi:hypothetical protein